MYLFSQLEKEVYKLNGDYGQELVVAVSPKNLTYKVEVIYPEYDY